MAGKPIHQRLGELAHDLGLALGQHALHIERRTHHLAMLIDMALAAAGEVLRTQPGVFLIEVVLRVRDEALECGGKLGVRGLQQGIDTIHELAVGVVDRAVSQHESIAPLKRLLGAHENDSFCVA